jgi:hypothetical protein
VFGCNVPGATVHDAELLVVLVGARVGVGVAVDDLECSFGILERHLLIVLRVILPDSLLLALLLVRRRAIAARL